MLYLHRKVRRKKERKTHLKCSDVLPKPIFWGKYGHFCWFVAEYDKLVPLSPIVKLFQRG